MPEPTTTTTNTALHALNDQLMALPQDQVSPPKTPVHALLRQGRAMLDFATLKDNAKALDNVGADTARLDLTAQSLDALDLAQRAWRSVYNRRAFEGQLRQRLEDAYDLRERTLAAADYNLEDDPQAKAVIQNVRQGEGHGDLIEDLGVLANVLAQHAKAFARDKTFDLKATVASLTTTATELAGELAAFEGGQASDYDQAIELRDRAATFAQSQLRELRRAGRYAFRDDPRAAAHFANPRSRRRATRADQNAPAPQQF